jgi:predicted carbohydrate-binding protein with CBM5 and CBM33 domain
LTEFAGQPGANKFTVMDEVNVPNQPGEYILGWRWDCEETDQVWASCADIVITDGPTPAPTPPAPTPPTPAPTPTPTPTPSKQCDGFKPDFSSFACYYKGCAEQKEGSKDCAVCCEGCHLESDPSKGTFCMEDKAVAEM